MASTERDIRRKPGPGVISVTASGILQSVRFNTTRRGSDMVRGILVSAVRKPVIAFGNMATQLAALENQEVILAGVEEPDFASNGSVVRVNSIRGVGTTEVEAEPRRARREPSDKERVRPVRHAAPVRPKPKPRPAPEPEEVEEAEDEEDIDYDPNAEYWEPEDPPADDDDLDVLPDE